MNPAQAERIRNNPLARHLLAARANCTWEELGAQVGITGRELTNLAMGYYPPQLRTLLRMADAFQWTAEELGEMIMGIDIGTPSDVLFGEPDRASTAAVPAGKRAHPEAGRARDGDLLAGVPRALQGRPAEVALAQTDRSAFGVGLLHRGYDGAIRGEEE